MYFLNHQLNTVTSHRCLGLVSQVAHTALWYPGYADKEGVFILSQTGWVISIAEIVSGSHRPSTEHANPVPRAEISYGWCCRGFLCAHLFQDKQQQQPISHLESGIKTSKAKATWSIDVHKPSPLTCLGFVKCIPPSSLLHASTSSKETSQVSLSP